MNKKAEHIKVPTYSTDRRQLFQVIEFIKNGKKVVVETPLQAYQSIERLSDKGTT